APSESVPDLRSQLSGSMTSLRNHTPPSSDASSSTPFVSQAPGALIGFQPVMSRLVANQFRALLETPGSANGPVGEPAACQAATAFACAASRCALAPGDVFNTANCSGPSPVARRL